MSPEDSCRYYYDCITAINGWQYFRRYSTAPIALEYDDIEFVISEAQEDQLTSRVEKGERARQDIFVYTMVWFQRIGPKKADNCTLSNGGEGGFLLFLLIDNEVCSHR